MIRKPPVRRRVRPLLTSRRNTLSDADEGDVLAVGGEGRGGLVQVLGARERLAAPGCPAAGSRRSRWRSAAAPSESAGGNHQRACRPAARRAARPSSPRPGSAKRDLVGLQRDDPDAATHAEGGLAGGAARAPAPPPARPARRARSPPRPAGGAGRWHPARRGCSRRGASRPGWQPGSRAPPHDAAAAAANAAGTSGPGACPTQLVRKEYTRAITEARPAEFTSKARAGARGGAP